MFLFCEAAIEKEKSKYNAREKLDNEQEGFYTGSIPRRVRRHAPVIRVVGI